MDLSLVDALGHGQYVLWQFEFEVKMARLVDLIKDCQHTGTVLDPVDDEGQRPSVDVFHSQLTLKLTYYYNPLIFSPRNSTPNLEKNRSRPNSGDRCLPSSEATPSIQF